LDCVGFETVPVSAGVSLLAVVPFVTVSVSLLAVVPCVTVSVPLVAVVPLVTETLRTASFLTYIRTFTERFSRQICTSLNLSVP
jgi:hypothetical protein